MILSQLFWPVVLCTATFLSTGLDEDVHEDIVGNTANLTNVDVSR